jgi:hypothetical protein
MCDCGGKCPTCGAPVKRCPHCGRVEYDPPNVYPYWVAPYYPYWYGPMFGPIKITTNGTGDTWTVTATSGFHQVGENK